LAEDCSEAAALRLWFSFEGIFRQHYIIKKWNRDTAWFAMIDKDWPDIKRNMEKWLYS
jgi:RimJ/RimL family protein N-acetyltransferase